MAQHPGTERSSPAGLAGLARANGTFAMLAIDQRESLRTLLVAAGHGAADADLSAFKVAVARYLSPAASGMLVDRDYGLGAIVAADAVAPTCGLIVAVDRFTQAPGGPLEWERARSTGAHGGAGRGRRHGPEVPRRLAPGRPRRTAARHGP